MGAWFLIVVVAMTVVMWRLASAVGAICQERARVIAHCTQMETAALNGAMLCERLPDGTTLLVMPGATHEEHDKADPIRYP